MIQSCSPGCAKNSHSVTKTWGTDGLHVDNDGKFVILTSSFSSPVPVDIKSRLRITVSWRLERLQEGRKLFSERDRIRDSSMCFYIGFGEAFRAKGAKFFFPKMPYTLGYFWGNREIVGKVYRANPNFPQMRFICLHKGTSPVSCVDSRDVIKDFIMAFPQFRNTPLPPISGIGIHSDLDRSPGRAAGIFEYIKLEQAVDTP